MFTAWQTAGNNETGGKLSPVLDTVEQLIAGVNNTGDKRKAANFVNIRNGPKEILRGPMETESR
jgi:hypothetical protein